MFSDCFLKCFGIVFLQIFLQFWTKQYNNILGLIICHPWILLFKVQQQNYYRFRFPHFQLQLQAKHNFCHGNLEPLLILIDAFCVLRKTTDQLKGSKFTCLSSPMTLALWLSCLHFIRILLGKIKKICGG